MSPHGVPPGRLAPPGGAGCLTRRHSGGWAGQSWGTGAGRGPWAGLGGHCISQALLGHCEHKPPNKRQPRPLLPAPSTPPGDHGAGTFQQQCSSAWGGAPTWDPAGGRGWAAMLTLSYLIARCAGASRWASRWPLQVTGWGQTPVGVGGHRCPLRGPRGGCDSPRPQCPLWVQTGPVCGDTTEDSQLPSCSQESGGLETGGFPGHTAPGGEEPRPLAPGPPSPTWALGLSFPHPVQQVGGSEARRTELWAWGRIFLEQMGVAAAARVPGARLLRSPGVDSGRGQGPGRPAGRWLW